MKTSYWNDYMEKEVQREADVLAAVTVKRVYAGCYLLSLGDDEAYVERSCEDPNLWTASNREYTFPTYREAKTSAAMGLVDNAEF